ncbi:O-antigen ligase family protein [Pontibacter sp. E15-1]|uniref:O-antigen ligase family protein n=1 Tax=Pontibacter sp. E15-1 TaxID=2919918 RepID=UPI001F502712|nr:O-antigen ligase family protein [Pontibacter sp. E15-1]MCJ8166401.1 O-antigen ligase family protein [Pontibacter sp. E15-1]
MKRILSFITIFTLFLDDFVLTRTPFDFYFYYIIFSVVVILYYIVKQQLPIDRKFLIILLLIFFISLVKTLLNEYPITSPIKQVIAILISSIPYYLIIKINKYDVIEVFRIYLKSCYLVCVLGIIQELTYIFFNIEYGYKYKVTSIVSEPAHLAIALAPAFFLAINKLLFKSETSLISHKQAWLIFITWLLTMSGVAMFGLVASFIIIALNKYNLLSMKMRKSYIFYTALAAVVIGSMLYFIYVKVPFIKYRIDDTVSVINPKQSQKLGDVNLSTYTLYINFQITLESLRHNPIFGSGLGTHRYNYDKYRDKVYNFQTQSYKEVEFNKDDANSLLLRILSELGLFGLLLSLVFLYALNIKKFDNSYNQLSKNLWLINNGCLLFFLMRLFRFGNYSVLGFFLFLFIFNFTYRQYKANLILNR